MPEHVIAIPSFPKRSHLRASHAFQSVRKQPPIAIPNVLKRPQASHRVLSGPEGPQDHQTAQEGHPGTAEGKTNAAGALENLAIHDDNRKTIAAKGGIESLIELLKSGTEEGKTQAAEALNNLACNNDDNHI